MFFSKFDVNRVEWLNLIFENRNQSYGAYELRLKSSYYLRNAMLLSAIGLSSLIVGSSIYSLVKHKNDDLAQVLKPPLDNDNTIYKITEVKLPPKQQIAATKMQHTAAAQKIDAKQIKYATPKVVREVVVDEVPTIEEINKSVIALQTVKGLEGANLNNTAGLIGGNGTSDGLDKGNGASDGNEAMLFADVMPEFPGGMSAWTKFLNRNLSYTQTAKDAGISGRVVVSFVVEKNGAITDLKVLQGLGYGLDQEALRVLKKSPLWKPGLQKGKPVRVAYVIPFVFRLDQ